MFTALHRWSETSTAWFRHAVFHSEHLFIPPVNNVPLFFLPFESSVLLKKVYVSRTVPPHPARASLVAPFYVFALAIHFFQISLKIFNSSAPACLYTTININHNTMRYNKVQLIIPISETLHKRFKRVVLDNDTTMAEVVRQCIKRYIDEHKNKQVVY